MRPEGCASFPLRPAAAASCLSEEELETKAQTEVAATVDRRAVVTIGNTAAPGVAAPTTPTAHTAGATGRTGWICLRRVPVTAIPVAAPFPYVSGHIVKS